jgi:predicted RNA binding protein YcfA (HicA-like mRNA interferase family)
MKPILKAAQKRTLQAKPVAHPASVTVVPARKIKFADLDIVPAAPVLRTHEDAGALTKAWLRIFLVMKIHEILTLLKEDGWYLVTTRGSHRQFKHPTKTGRVTVSGKPSDDLAIGTLNSIQKQAKLKE